MHISFIICITGTLFTGHLSYSLFISAIIMSSEPTTEQAIKALQAQFQELVMSLAQGQQELKTLILKKKKKKKRTSGSILDADLGMDYRMRSS